MIMKCIEIVWIVSLLFVFSKPASGQPVGSYDHFRKGFEVPPASAQPIVYHWWLGGNVDTLRLREEITAFKNAGISGFTIFEIGSPDTVLVKAGPAFLSDESLASIRFAVKEAGRLGLEVGLNTASSWNAGGSWIPPKHAAKSIYHTKIHFQAGKAQQVKIPFPVIPEKDAWGKSRLIQFGPDGKPVFREEIALLAVPVSGSGAYSDTARIIEISQFFDPEKDLLQWKAPAGEWEIWRFVCSNSGENLILPSKHSAGPIMDHYDAEATGFHFNYIIGRLKSAMGDLRHTALKSLYMASYEAKGFTWTTTLPQVFRELNGYGPEKLLPLLFVDSLYPEAVKAKFRADFQRTLSELMITNFYKKSKEICNSHGLKNNCEAGGPGLPLHNVPVEPLKALGSLDIPRGEFWINHSRWNEQGMDILRVVKEVSAASNIYGRGIVEMEAFTTFQHWQEGPFEMKPAGDRAFSEGMNKVVVHGATHNPSGTGYPGIVYGAGTHYNDKRVWWPKVKPFNEYLARISWILREADFTADILYYYGDTIPNYGGHKNSRFTPGAGYEYELINTEKLMTLIVKDNQLLIPNTGATFKILVLAREREINPEVLMKLQDLLKGGAVIAGVKPSGVQSRPGSISGKEAVGLLNSLWEAYQPGILPGKHRKVLSGISAVDLLRLMNVPPDCSYPGSDLFTLDYTHYAKAGLDFYFVRNTTGKWVSEDIRFRQQNKTPEIWDPVSGSIVPVSLYRQDETHISLPLTLAPYGSIFLVFRQGNLSPASVTISGSGTYPPALSYVNGGIILWDQGDFTITSAGKTASVTNLVKESILNGPWEVFFPKGWGAPESAVFPALTSWTDSPEERIKYFSGIARYEKNFIHDINSVSEDGYKMFLDLGDLSHVAEVWLNGRPLGILWAKPYRLEITGSIKPGLNKLVVEVANTWSNRLAGDAITGSRYTSTNIKVTDIDGALDVRLPWAKVPLIRSGLFGPVTIQSVKPVRY